MRAPLTDFIPSDWSMVGVTGEAANAAAAPAISRNAARILRGMPPIIMGDHTIMRSIPGWDQYYLDICKVVASRSKDPNTQIGCVIIGPNHEIRSTGYNSFPRGIRDDVPERLVRPTKYLWIEHAERNAICNAARAGTAT